MPPIFLIIVKVAFLIILYLFVYRAVRAVLLDVYGPPARRRVARPAARASSPVTARAASRRPPRELAVIDGQGRRSVPLKESMTIGRAATCDVAVNDSYVSNQHARIYLRDGSWWLEDLRSTNGTYLNRTRVTVPTPISPGDEIRIGKVTLELRR